MTQIYDKIADEKKDKGEKPKKIEIELSNIKGHLTDYYSLGDEINVKITNKVRGRTYKYEVAGMSHSRKHNDEWYVHELMLSKK